MKIPKNIILLSNGFITDKKNCSLIEILWIYVRYLFVKRYSRLVETDLKELEPGDFATFTDQNLDDVLAYSYILNDRYCIWGNYNVTEYKGSKICYKAV